jgi:hypothetical protein
LVPGNAEGDDGGGYRWHYHVTEIDRQRQPAGLSLFQIEVGIAWTSGGHRREVLLRTERVGRLAGGGNG